MKKTMPFVAVMLIVVLVGAFYAYRGVVMHGQVAVEEAKFHAAQDAYFSLSKAERDGAATGSALSAQLVEIKNYPSSLLELKLVGVGKILTGIFLILLAILMALIMMPVRLGQIVRRES